MNIHSDATLMGMSKKDLVEYVRMKEHNEAAAIQALEQQAENLKDWEPVRRGRWVNWGKSGTPTYENYGTCSVCHEDAEIHTEHRNYCPNCGAKMDGKPGEDYNGKIR